MACILITGANGYIGSAITKEMSRRGHTILAGTRIRCPALDGHHGTSNIVYGDLTAVSDFSSILNGVDVVIHTAAMVHRRIAPAEAAASIFDRLNRQLVQDLARDACSAGVNRIILLSTIAVHGKGSVATSIDAESPLSPVSAYAISKAEAEEVLRSECAGSSTEWTIIRPSMVYGENSPGNFDRLVRAVRRRIPLPFRSINNRRSILSIDHLVDLIALAVERPGAKGEVFVAADASPTSTRDIVEAIGEGLGQKAITWPLRPSLMAHAGRVLGMEDTVSSLIDDFVVDSGKACEILGWVPAGYSRVEIVRYLRSTPGSPNEWG